MPTLITVVPVYNGARTLAATLASVAAQTRRPDRVLILDNGSTDGTREVAMGSPGLKTEWRLNERNLGMFGNMNRGLECAPEADFLHLLHADDLVRPDFYARMCEALERMPRRGLAYCQSEFVDDAGLPCRLGRRRSTGFENCQNVAAFLARREELQPVVCPAVMLRTGRKEVPVRFREDMPQLADLVFWAEWAAATGNVASLPDVLCDYRVHAGSATAANATRLQTFVLDEWKAMRLVAGLRPLPERADWLRMTKQRLIFAARSQDKAWANRGQAPEFAREIRRAVVPITGWPFWMAAKFVVGLRIGFHYLRRA